MSVLEETENESDQETDMVHREDYEEALDEIKNLRSEVAELKNSVMERDMQIREELTNTYSQMIKKIELDWR